MLEFYRGLDRRHSAISQNCMRLLSAVLAIVQCRSWDQLNSRTEAEWPPWINMSSGGPSRASSSLCFWEKVFVSINFSKILSQMCLFTCPTRLMSHKYTLLLAPDEPKRLRRNGDQAMWRTPCLPWNSLVLGDRSCRVSQTLTWWSQIEPVATWWDEMLRSKSE